MRKNILVPMSTPTTPAAADETNNLVLEAFLNLGINLDRIIAEHGPFARHYLDDSDERLRPGRTMLPPTPGAHGFAAQSSPFIQQLSALVQAGCAASAGYPEEIPMDTYDDACAEEPRLLAAHIVLQAQTISQLAHELVNALDTLKDGARGSGARRAAAAAERDDLHLAITQMHGQTRQLEELVRQFAGGRRAALSVIEGARSLRGDETDSTGVQNRSERA